MTTPHALRATAHHDLNHLRRGVTYLATTAQGVTVGEYLGMEAPYGERAILLRDGRRTESITVDSVRSILPVAA